MFKSNTQDSHSSQTLRGPEWPSLDLVTTSTWTPGVGTSEINIRKVVPGSMGKGCEKVRGKEGSLLKVH